ncbi:MAG: phosphate ABC transporter permease PstA [Coriobacteriia bacterium]
MKKSIQYRNFKNGFFKGIVILLTTLCTLPLLFILYRIFKEGISAINWDFFVNLPKPVGEMLILIASVIAIPLGISIGIYLSEYKKTKLAYMALLSVDVLQGIPSIVIGIIIYLWVVKTTGNFSAISGSIALSIMMLPSIIKSTEETLKLVPDTLKEASLSLGVPYYRTILKVILPAGITGILSGIILSIARVAGETAPLLFTAFGNPFMNTNVLKPVSSLPAIIFNYAISPYEDWHKLAWGASFILIVIVLFLNIITKIAQKKWQVQF